MSCCRPSVQRNHHHSEFLRDDSRILCPIPDSCVRFRNLASVFQFLRPIWDLGAGFQKRTQDLEIGHKNPKTDARFRKRKQDSGIGHTNYKTDVRIQILTSVLQNVRKVWKSDTRILKRTQDFENRRKIQKFNA